MNQPLYHNRAPHVLWCDKWNPYQKRDEVHFLIDKKIDDIFLSYNNYVSGEYNCFLTGCLDAPSEIPLGGTESMKTIAGYYRENYMVINREMSSLKDKLIAEQKMAELIKDLLEQTK